MPLLHTIRLVAEWDCQPLPPRDEDGVEAPSVEPQRVALPHLWSATFAPLPERVRYTRRFGCPTDLTDERVELVIAAARHQATATLNGEPLGDFTETQPLRVDVTARLQPRNELVVLVEAHPESAGFQAGGLLGEAWLEILY